MSERAQQTKPVQGDEAALYERHAERLQRSVAHALGGDRHHAEDACAFAWAQLVAIQPERTERIFAWLRTTAIRKGIELATQQRREAAPGAEDADELCSWEERVVDAEVLERSLEGREAAETLKALRPREARYLALLAAGYSYAEIAEREGGEKHRGGS